jgi:3-dehydroquinate synthase
MPSVPVNLGPRSYRIAIGEPAAEFTACVRAASPRARAAMIVHDAAVAGVAASLVESLTDAGLTVAVHAVPSGETSKSPAELQRIYDALAAMPADRGTPVIAVGGGVIGDLAGFAAATFNRGLPLVMVPTTLLAMVDSAVGGKTAINHPRGKNLIGAFHQPAAVWIDPSVLASLPAREFTSGLAEVVKYGVILDADLFHWLDVNPAAIIAREPAAILHIIERSCQLKGAIVEVDEREETGLRAVLNYGHTFAHAFETAANYTGLLHGEAVAMGMHAAARLAARLNRCDIVTEQESLLHALGLPTAINSDWPMDELIATMRRDKKAVAGSLRFVLPARLGHVELVDGVSDDLVREVLAS